MLWKLTLLLINDGLVLWLNVMFRLISAPSRLSTNKGNKPNSWLADGQISTANVGSRADNQPSGRKRVKQPAEARRRHQRCRLQTDRNKRGVSLVFPAALVLLNPSCCSFQDMSVFIWLMLLAVLLNVLWLRRLSRWTPAMKLITVKWEPLLLLLTLTLYMTL